MPPPTRPACHWNGARFASEWRPASHRNGGPLYVGMRASFASDYPARFGRNSHHKGDDVRKAVEGAGATLLFLPPYSPDFNPIENAFSKLKSLLRKAAARTVDDLWRVIGDCMDAFTPAECQNYFAHCGYDAF
jgi:hypothetical protein